MSPPLIFQGSRAVLTCGVEICDSLKLVDYLLNLSHIDGHSKAKFFLGVGFTQEKWEAFATALRKHAQTHDVAKIEMSPLGYRYVIEGDLNTPLGGQRYVRVVWFIKTDEDVPRLVTAYPISRKENEA